jgi:starvation-inducible DNA-binding protein
MKKTEQKDEQPIHKLNKLLANEFTLSFKTRSAHWNVVGKDFHQKHLFFETQYKELDEAVDAIAERIRSLSVNFIASAAELIELSDLTESADKKNRSEDLIRELLSCHNQILTHIREILIQSGKTDDIGTTDLLSRLIGVHEKMAWMLRTHLA